MNNELPDPAPESAGAAANQRIAQLEHEVASLRAEVATHQHAMQRLRVFEALVEHAKDSIMVVNPQGQFVYINPAWQDLSGYDIDYDQPFVNMIAPEDRQTALDSFQTTLDTGMWQGRLRYLRPDGSTFIGQVTTFLVSNEPNQTANAVGFVRDVTAQVHAEAEREALQQQIIEVQQQALRELATPLIPVADSVVVLPLVGAMSGERIQQVMEVLLEGIAAYQAEFAILDVTGVRVVDTYVAQGLLRAAQAAKLLGTRVIITGISSEIALTLVHIGANLNNLITRSNLQSGIAYALENK